MYKICIAKTIGNFLKTVAFIAGKSENPAA